MTPKQIELARHALGLDGRCSRSYRNRFIAGPGHDDFGEWQKMAEVGDAVDHGPRSIFGGDHRFTLTRKGAEAALRAGEGLDAEDFPELRT